MTSTLAIVLPLPGRRQAGRPGRREDEAGSAVGDVLDPDPSAVGLDERLGDGQPEAGSAPGVESHEPVEHRLALVGRDARARVGNRQRDLVAARPRRPR